jgi:UDP-N-acetylmuramate--alanine ligase
MLRIIPLHEFLSFATLLRWLADSIDLQIPTYKTLTVDAVIDSDFRVSTFDFILSLMHIYFSGIGGTGIGPLALIAKQAGYEVSGSDKQDSQYLNYLKDHGITNIHIGIGDQAIDALNQKSPIDWLVYSSAVIKEQPDHPEIKYAVSHDIRHSKRDEFLSEFIDNKNLKLIAVAGTHGKSTTTAMLIWLFKQLNVPISYSVGAKLSFGEMGCYNPTSQYFIYECDEYDHNFLAFKPHYSVITGISWDHPDIYPTKISYEQAFVDFIKQSYQTLIWQEDADSLGLIAGEQIAIINKADYSVVELVGEVDRQNGALAAQAAVTILNLDDLAPLIDIINRFPGLARRFEKLAPNLYSDYAHTAEKITGALQKAREVSDDLVVVYEGLHNSRQHFMLSQGQFKGLFDGVKKLYWVPSYLARENPSQELLTPSKLIELTGLDTLAEAQKLDDSLWQKIQNHTKNQDLVLIISAGGGDSLDEWIRDRLKPESGV